ncbi:MAG: dimethylargininase [Carbonactinosporaceae bacterium]
MCPPAHFEVSYTINPWMDPARPVDGAAARRQWDSLRRAYLELGHRVDMIEPLPGLPDMVFAANGGLVVGGRVLGSRFRNSERAAEGPSYLDWFRRNGFTETRSPEQVNEGEGDFLVAGDIVLAGAGFRTDPEAHREAQEFFGRPVVSLQLIDPRFYHLDTALAVLDQDTVAYHADAFSRGSRQVLERLFPTAIRVGEPDAAVLGLNAVSDGLHVVLAAQATGFAAALRDHGYVPVPVDLSEFLKAGGGAKCATLEIRT